MPAARAIQNYAVGYRSSALAGSDNVLTFHDPIPDVRQQVCNALLAQEYWHRGEQVSNANALLLRLNDVFWHRFFIDAGVVFWKTVRAPDQPTQDGDHSYPYTDIARLHHLTGKRLSGIDLVDLPGGGALRLAFESGPALILHSRNDTSRLVVEHAQRAR